MRVHQRSAAVVVVVGIVGVAVLVGGPLRSDSLLPVASATSTETNATIRGGWSGWITLTHPTDWYTATSQGEVAVQTRHPLDDAFDGGPSAAFVFRGGMSLCAEMDCTMMPEGTVSQPVMVDGRAATEYVVPPEDLGGGYLVGRSFIDVPADEGSGAGPSAIELHSAALNQSAYDQNRLDLTNILSTVVFVSDYVKTDRWTETLVSSPSLPTLGGFTVCHPSGWIVTQATTGVQIISNSPAVSIVFEPDQPDTAWKNATPILGSDSIRKVSMEVIGGRQITVYIMRHPVRDIAVTASVPASAFGSPDYWTYEQTVWAVMSLSGFTYLDAYP